MPMAATTQMVAAVVRPLTCSPWCMIAPAPMKPMPVTIWAAMRVGSASTTPVKFLETIMNKHAPTQIRMLVRRPAALSESSRSMPMIAPKTSAMQRLSESCMNSVMFPPVSRHGELGRAAAGTDAVGQADAGVGAAGEHEARVILEARLQPLQAPRVPDVVLRIGLDPARRLRGDGLDALEAEDAVEVLAHARLDAHDRGLGGFLASGAADEGSNDDLSRGRALRELARRVGRGGERRLLAAHGQKPEALELHREGRGVVDQGHGRGRDESDLPQAVGQLGVEALDRVREGG